MSTNAGSTDGLRQKGMQRMQRKDARPARPTTRETSLPGDSKPTPSLTFSLLLNLPLIESEVGSWLQPEPCQSAPENRNSEDEMRSVAQAAQGEEACGADSDTGTSSSVVYALSDSHVHQDGVQSESSLGGRGLSGFAWQRGGVGERAQVRLRG